MERYPMIETFVSIDGEGPSAGRLAAFLRFQGCNLRCRWCDTTYSFGTDNITSYTTAQELYDYVKTSGACCVTLTGGEPLIQPDIEALLALLDNDPELEVHIETNGSVDITPFKAKFPSLSFIVDYKLPGSGMTAQMTEENLTAVDRNDAYKFVVSSMADLQAADAVITKWNLCERTQVFLSPVLGEMEPAAIVDYMKEQKLNRVRLQLQLHKFIWHPDERGV